MASDIWVTAATGAIGVTFGAAFQYFSSRLLDRRKRFDEARGRAYADFVHAVASLTIGQRDQIPETAADALAELTDAKTGLSCMEVAEWWKLS